jgi:hypothetical protein
MRGPDVGDDRVMRCLGLHRGRRAARVIVTRRLGCGRRVSTEARQLKGDHRGAKYCHIS